MELALNLFWFLLALASLAAWFRRKPGARLGPRRRAAWLRGLVALSYALVILFFSISVTDDLNAEAAVLEETKSCQQGCKDGDSRHDTSNSGKLKAPPPAITCPEFVFLRGQSPVWMSFTDLRRDGVVRARSSKGRAPPLLHS
jgi:hypothetical protein